MSALRTTALVLALSASALCAAVGADRTTVSVAAPWEIKSLDPSVSGFAFQRMQVMETLVDADASGRIRPGLATEWMASDDGLTWRFALRSGVTFHDGTALEAEVVAAALARAAGRPGVLGKAPVNEILADGDAVVITLHAPFAALPSLLAHSTTVIPAPDAFDADGNPVAAIAPGTWWALYVGIALTLWVEYFRYTRARTRVLLATPAVEASRLLGLGPGHVLRRQIGPEIGPGLLTIAAFGAATTVASVAALGFIGIGLRPPTAEWGVMMAELLPYWREAPWLILQPIGCLVFTVIALHLVVGSAERTGP